MNQVLSVFVVVVCMLAVNCDAVKCPVKNGVTKFNIPSYNGRWYEIQRYQNRLQDGNCVHSDITGNTNLNVVTKQNKGTSKTVDTLQSTLNPADQSGNGNLILTVTGSPGDRKYTVLDTDYTDYAVAYSCREAGEQIIEGSWILSRKPTLSAAAQQKVDGVIAKNGLDKSRYALTRQTDCTY